MHDSKVISCIEWITFVLLNSDFELYKVVGPKWDLFYSRD